MSLPRAAWLALGAAALAACYHGTDSVPHQTTSSGTGGAATTTATTASSGGSTTSSSSTSTTGTGGGTGGANPCATALLCDDFESYPVGAPPGGKWSANQNTGSVAVDGTHVRSGAKSVKVTGDAASGYRSAMMSVSSSVLPAAGGVVYGRMMFWLESAPQTSVHWTFIAGSGLVPGQSYHAIYRYGGQQPVTSSGTFTGSQLMANYDTPDSYQTPPVGPSSDCWLQSNKEVVPVGAWTCAEWMFDTPNNTMRFWQNGTELTDLAMTGKGQGCVSSTYSGDWLAPTVSTLSLGWESYQVDAARTIWIDDVAVGEKRLGCPP